MGVVGFVVGTGLVVVGTGVVANFVGAGVVAGVVAGGGWVVLTFNDGGAWPRTMLGRWAVCVTVEDP